MCHQAGAGGLKRVAGESSQQRRASKHPRRSCTFEGEQNHTTVFCTAQYYTVDAL